ncbi:brachyurin-like [Zophobas morio]|uniref:brachyurin-like n=1 Tax=Zophobas morio TaxID=2755281 RepID=UPI003083B1F3
MDRHGLICFYASVIIYIYKVEAAAERHYGARIIGGQEAFAGQFPFAAAVHVQTTDSKFFCGGALTGNDWVITAGHCVYNGVLFTIQLGSNHLESDDSGRMTIATSTYILHPDFNPDTIENDIGLIKFRRPINYTIYLNPVFPPEFSLQDNAPVYVLGWGQTSDSDPELSNELRFLYIRTISNAECRTIYGNQITDNMVCVAGNYNEGTCIGDNGSPLVQSYGKYYALVGVASFVSANGCESVDPSGYTRTYPYLEWIQNNTRQEEYV